MEASIGMVFQVCFWERRKLQLVAACASKPVVVRYFLLHELLLRFRFATEICIMANGIGFGPAEVAQENRDMRLSHGQIQYFRH